MQKTLDSIFLYSKHNRDGYGEFEGKLPWDLKINMHNAQIVKMYASFLHLTKCQTWRTRGQAQRGFNFNFHQLQIQGPSSGLFIKIIWRSWKSHHLYLYLSSRKTLNIIILINLYVFNNGTWIRRSNRLNSMNSHQERKILQRKKNGKCFGVKFRRNC